MKSFIKFSLAALVTTCIVYTGCKKADLQPINQSAKTQGDQKAMATKIANDFFNSFTSQPRTSNQRTNGLGVRAAAQCGDATITPINQIFTRNDTTFTLNGKSVFTYTCKQVNGANPAFPNSYTFADTLRTSESGKGFANNTEGFQMYDVTNLTNGDTYDITGHMHAWARYTTVADKGVTEQHDFSTDYQLKGNGAVATTNSAATLLGEIAFRCSQTDVYPSATDKNSLFRYAGYMDVQQNVIVSYFFVEGENYFMKYELDRNTRKILSGPVRANYTPKNTY